MSILFRHIQISIACLMALLIAVGCGDDPVTTSQPYFDEASPEPGAPLSEYERRFGDSHLVRYAAPFPENTAILNDSARRGPGLPLMLQGDYSIEADGGLRIDGDGPDEAGGIATPGDDARLPQRLRDAMAGSGFTAEFFVHTGGITIHGGISSPARVFAIGEGIANNTLVGGFHEQVEGALELQFQLPDAHFERRTFMKTSVVRHDQAHHVALVYRREGERLGLYVDGQLESTAVWERLDDSTPQQISQADLPEALFSTVGDNELFVVANTPRGTTRYFSGIIYHMAIHDRAHDADEISAMNELLRQRYCGQEGC